MDVGCMSSAREPPTLVDPLALLSSGELEITVGGAPFLSLRPNQKEVEVRMEGAIAAGVRISAILEDQADRVGFVRGAGSLAKRLTSLGWTLTLSDQAGPLVTMGRAASRLTGHVSVHPLALRRLLAAIRQPG